MDCEGHLGELVGAHEDVDDKGRELQHEGADESQGHGKAPHAGYIKNHAVSGISAASKERGDKNGIDDLSQLIHHIYIKHDLKVMCCGL